MVSPPTNLIAPRLLNWAAKHGRHNLPWQTDPTPYRVWVSEVMLQQTQVATALPYYHRFTARFPDVSSLAAASLDEVLHHWSGLGYYARARNLHRAAGIVVEQHNGCVPNETGALQALPGIGRSTASAVLALSWGQRHAILDANARRLIARLFAVEGDPAAAETVERLWTLADACTPHHRVAEYTQAIMDLGATVCLRKAARLRHLSAESTSVRRINKAGRTTCHRRGEEPADRSACRVRSRSTRPNLALCFCRSALRSRSLGRAMELATVRHSG